MQPALAGRAGEPQLCAGLWLGAVHEPSALQGSSELWRAERATSCCVLRCLQSQLMPCVRLCWVVPGSAVAAAGVQFLCPGWVCSFLCGLRRNGLRGRLLIRNESFLSSAPFPHSLSCGCFCLEQIGLRVAEAEPLGQAVSAAPVRRQVSGSTGQRQRPDPSPAARWPRARWPAGG